MSAPFENKNAEKLRTPEQRQYIFKKFCEWLAKGKIKYSFSLREEGLSCCYITLERYMKLFPEEFDLEEMETAYCQGYSRWEQIAEDSAEGKNKDANTASLQMILRNKFKWDQRVPEREVTKSETHAERIFQAIDT